MTMFRVFILAASAGALFGQQPSQTPVPTPVPAPVPSWAHKPVKSVPAQKPIPKQGRQKTEAQKGKTDQGKTELRPPAEASRAVAKPAEAAPKAQQPAASVEASPWDDIGGGFRACRKGDDSPAGTQKDGWKKVLVPTPMGNGCHWERADAAADQGRTESRPPAEASGTAAKPAEAAPKAQQGAVEASPWDDIGGGFRACRKGDDSPAGTQKDGWKKVLVPTPMGNGCHWERAN